MTKLSKRKKEIVKIVDSEKKYSVQEALALLQQQPQIRFDQTVDISLCLGVNPKKSDQQVRGTVSLPNGTGKKTSILVFTSGPKVQEALDAGADFAGSTELIEKVKGGWTDFDVVVATPDMMREVGKLGKVLGPRGLMPTPKAGTVTTDVKKAVEELKAGKIEFKVDRYAVVSSIVGKLSFAKEKLEENVAALVAAINRAKPSTAKGHYLKSIVLSSTMGPGLKVDTRPFIA